jgi:pimeloyl-ACP methyl ester carboxylesterase
VCADAGRPERWASRSCADIWARTALLVLVGLTAVVSVIGDDVIRLIHTSELYEALPVGQPCRVPATSHALPIERPGDVARIILEFLTADATPPTMMPVRRATSGAH